MAKRNIGEVFVEETQYIEHDVEIEIKKRNIKRIKIVDIEKNPLNIYPMNNITELADNLLANGLMEPLVGYLTDDGTFRLLGGHRRLSGLLMNLSRGGDEYAECITIKKPLNKKIELKIIGILNCKREMDDKTKEVIVDQYKKLYEDLTPEERLINGETVKMREWIGVQIGISGRQVQTYISRNKPQVEATSTKKAKNIKTVSKKCLLMSSMIADYSDDAVIDNAKKEDCIQLIDNLRCLSAEIEGFLKILEN